MQTEREKICQEFGYDPIATLSVDDWDKMPAGRSVLRDATTAVARVGADVLRPLIVEGNPNISSRALHIFSELGRSGAVLIADVVSSLGHPYGIARWSALDGLLYHSSVLTPEQISKAIVLASDPDPLVRTKVIEFIAAVPLLKIENAHSVLSPADQLAGHKKGLAFLKASFSADGALEALAGSEVVTSCYVYAGIVAAAKSGNFIEIPEGKIDSEEADYVRKMLERKKKLAAMKNLPIKERRAIMNDFLGRST